MKQHEGGEDKRKRKEGKIHVTRIETFHFQVRE